MNELEQFEYRMKRQLDDFLTPEAKKRKPVARPDKPAQGLTVRLAVREKKNSFLDEVFEHQSSSISRLEAKLEAERAARNAGWPVISYLIDYQ